MRQSLYLILKRFKNEQSKIIVETGNSPALGLIKLVCLVAIYNKIDMESTQ